MLWSIYPWTIQNISTACDYQNTLVCRRNPIFSGHLNGKLTYLFSKYDQSMLVRTFIFQPRRSLSLHKRQISNLPLRQTPCLHRSIEEILLIWYVLFTKCTLVILGKKNINFCLRVVRELSSMISFVINTHVFLFNLLWTVTTQIKRLRLILNSQQHCNNFANLLLWLTRIVKQISPWILSVAFVNKKLMLLQQFSPVGFIINSCYFMGHIITTNNI